MKTLVCLAFLVAVLGMSIPATWGAVSQAAECYQRGVRQFYLQQTQEAVASFHEAITLEPDAPMAHIMLSRALLQAHDPAHAFTESTLALAHIDRASDQALDCTKESIRLSQAGYPELDATHHRLQVVWERKGHADMVKHFSDRAQAIWSQADAGALDRLRERLRAVAAGQAAPF